MNRPPASSTADRVRDYLSIARVPSALPVLDGLRALAILMVLARHGVRVVSRRGGPVLPLGAWDGAAAFFNGWAGVDLFFVLSGFLITYHLSRRWRPGAARASLKQYLLKRILRIFPAYYAFLLFVVLVGVPGFSVDPENLGWRVGYHLLYLQDYLDSNIVVAFWSLGLEEKFYLLAPLLVVPFLGGAHRRLRGGVLLALVALPAVFRFVGYLGEPGAATYGVYFETLRSPFHMSFEGFVIGSACAFFFLEREEWGEQMRRRRGLQLQILGMALLLLLLLPAPLVENVSLVEATLVGTLLALGFGATMLGLLLTSTRLKSWLESRRWLFFSRISYSLYLVHLTLTEVTYQSLDRLLGLSGLSAAAQLGIYLPVFCGVSTAAALALHYLVEKPFLRLKERL